MNVLKQYQYLSDSEDEVLALVCAAVNRRGVSSPSRARGARAGSPRMQRERASAELLSLPRGDGGRLASGSCSGAPQFALVNIKHSPCVSELMDPRSLPICKAEEIPRCRERVRAAQVPQEKSSFCVCVCVIFFLSLKWDDLNIIWIMSEQTFV